MANDEAGSQQGFTVRTITLYLYTCSQCGFETADRTEITRHVKEHHGICINGETQSNGMVLNDLVQHQLAASGGDGKPTKPSRGKKRLTCAECLQTFVYEANFKRHMKVTHAVEIVAAENNPSSGAAIIASFPDGSTQPSELSAPCVAVTAAPSLNHMGSDGGKDVTDDATASCDDSSSPPVDGQDRDLAEVDNDEEATIGVSNAMSLIKAEDELTIANWCDVESDVLASCGGADGNSQILLLTADNDGNSHESSSFIPLVLSADEAAQVIAAAAVPSDIGTSRVLKYPLAKKLPFTCSCHVCGRHFVHESYLTRHLRLSHTGTEADLECKVCGRMFANPKYMRRHIRSVHDRADRPTSLLERPYECGICGARFTRQANVHRHLRNGHATIEDSYFMSSDGAANESSQPVTAENGNASDSIVTDEMDVVQKWRNAAKKCKCHLCGEQFFWRTGLRKHLKQKHSGGGGGGSQSGGSAGGVYRPPLIHRCTKCNRRFSHLNHLRCHLVAHARSEGLPLGAFGVRRSAAAMDDTDAAEPPASYLCNECGQIFASLHGLTCHMKRHEPGLRHTCTKCSAAFRTSKALWVHMETHERQHFVCEQCGHESRTRSGFRNHMRHIHPPPGSELPPFACDRCTRRCWSARALRLHMIAHADAGIVKRKSMCAVCGMRFRHIYNLGFHVVSSHPGIEMPFACATCHERFDSGDAFKAHYRSKHRNR